MFKTRDEQMTKLTEYLHRREQRILDNSIKAKILSTQKKYDRKMKHRKRDTEIGVLSN